jgi:WhiB family redox-sensing transcriptional regulator
MGAGGLVTGTSEPDQAGRDRAAGMPAGSRGVAFCGWMSRGACVGEDPELFFPIAATGSALYQISAAKRVCQRCTVRALCLTYAVETGQSGIWGGTILEERFAMREPSRWHSGEQASCRGRARVPEHAEPAGRPDIGRAPRSIRNPGI